MTASVYGWRLMMGIAVLAAPTTAAAQEKAVGRRPEARAGQNWALIIGIDKYDSFQQLRYCVKDARLLAETLQRKCGYAKDHIFLMVDGVEDLTTLPSRRKILSKANLVAKLPRKQDTLLFYFSGHGMSIDGSGYLVPFDAEKAEQSEMVSIGKLREILRGSKAERRVMILDACHSGTEKSADNAAMTKSFEDSLQADPEGIVTLASCKARETSLEAPWHKQGLFTYWLVQGLSGGADQYISGNKDGRVEIMELYDFVSQHVRIEAVQKRSHQQNPFLLAAVSGQIDLAHLSKTAHGSDVPHPSQAENEPRPPQVENESGTVRVEGGRLIVTVRVPCKSGDLDDVLSAKGALFDAAEAAARRFLRKKKVKDIAGALRKMGDDEVRREGKMLIGVYSLPIGKL